MGDTQVVEKKVAKQPSKKVVEELTKKTASYNDIMNTLKADLKDLTQNKQNYGGVYSCEAMEAELYSKHIKGSSLEKTYNAAISALGSKENERARYMFDYMAFNLARLDPPLAKDFITSVSALVSRKKEEGESSNELVEKLMTRMSEPWGNEIYRALRSTLNPSSSYETKENPAWTDNERLIFLTYTNEALSAVLGKKRDLPICLKFLNEAVAITGRSIKATGQGISSATGAGTYSAGSAAQMATYSAIMGNNSNIDDLTNAVIYVPIFSALTRAGADVIIENLGGLIENFAKTSVSADYPIAKIYAKGLKNGSINDAYAFMQLASVIGTFTIQSERGIMRNASNSDEITANVGGFFWGVTNTVASYLKKAKTVDKETREKLIYATTVIVEMVLDNPENADRIDGSVVKRLMKMDKEDLNNFLINLRDKSSASKYRELNVDQMIDKFEDEKGLSMVPSRKKQRLA
ncbi:MAG: hypothetical protein NTY68_00615 [Candidatus Micrarchaeota archaeon]|nr:hypothetical protein [Candidatus Micrarchaeota archaeon]